jgi:hypothetical protein
MSAMRLSPRMISMFSSLVSVLALLKLALPLPTIGAGPSGSTSMYFVCTQ